MLMPPDGIETAINMENQQYVLMSYATSLTWSDRHTPDDIPWLFALTAIHQRLTSTGLDQREHTAAALQL